MLVMAIGALHQIFIHAMMERLAELRLNVSVAGVAKFWLFFHQQELRFGGVVRRMAVYTRNIICGVLRALEIAVLLAILMTGQATRGNRGGRRTLEYKNLGLIA